MNKCHQLNVPLKKKILMMVINGMFAFDFNLPLILMLIAIKENKGSWNRLVAS